MQPEATVAHGSGVAAISSENDDGAGWKAPGGAVNDEVLVHGVEVDPHQQWDRLIRPRLPVWGALEWSVVVVLFLLHAAFRAEEACQLVNLVVLLSVFFFLEIADTIMPDSLLKS